MCKLYVLSLQDVFAGKSIVWAHEHTRIANLVYWKDKHLSSSGSCSPQFPEPFKVAGIKGGVLWVLHSYTRGASICDEGESSILTY